MQIAEMVRERYADDGNPPLPFERWRALAPRIAALPPEDRTDLLASAGIDATRWERADAYWSLTLATECARGDHDRAADFGRACAEAHRASARVGEDGAKFASGSNDEPANRRDVAPVDPERTAPPALDVPSFLRVGSGEGRSRSPQTVQSPWMATATTMEREAPGGGPSHATVALAPFAAPAEALPFRPGPSTLAIPSPNAAAAPRAPGETVEISGAMAPHLAGPFGPPARSPRGTAILDPDVIERILQGSAPPKR